MSLKPKHQIALIYLFLVTFFASVILFLYFLYTANFGGNS